MPKRFDAVIFDMDGLMFETQRCYLDAERELCSRRGCRLTPQISNQMMGRVGLESMQVLKTALGWSDRAADLLAERDGIYERLLETGGEPCRGLTLLLDRLTGEGLQLAIASSSQRKHVSFLCQRYDVGRYFSAVVTGDDVRHGKPDPEIFLAAASKLGVNPQQAAVLEDAENGIRAARAGSFGGAVLIPHQDTLVTDHALPDLIASGLDDPQLMKFLIG